MTETDTAKTTVSSREMLVLERLSRSDAALTVAEVATRTSGKPDAVRRSIRALVGRGLVEEAGVGEFSATTFRSVEGALARVGVAPETLRWASCAKDLSWDVARHRHLNRKGSIYLLCGATASSPEVWRGNTSKPECPTCLETTRGRSYVAV